ncbi:IS110 family transposase, partial [Clostridium neonatale]
MISVGIDVSKEKSTVCILKEYGEVISEPHEINHTETDLKALVESISELNEET